MAVNHFALGANLIVPFRANIKEGTISGQLPSSEFKATISMSYLDYIELGHGFRVDTKLCTSFVITTTLPFAAGLVEAKTWVTNNGSLVLNERILPVLNHFLLHLKYVEPDPFHTAVVRNVGELDLVYYNIGVDGESRYARGTSTIFSGKLPESRTVIDRMEISRSLPKEWVILLRSVDLVNHGYYMEGLVIAFSLLDAMAQDFVKDRLPNISSDEARQLLKRIQTSRLYVFLGSLTRIAIGKSPLDETPMAEEIRWLNDKRNAIMHQGEDCSHEEAQRGITAVHETLSRLSNSGGNFVLPEQLPFWTPSTAS